METPSAFGFRVAQKNRQSSKICTDLWPLGVYSESLIMHGLVWYILVSEPICEILCDVSIKLNYEIKSIRFNFCGFRNDALKI